MTPKSPAVGIPASSCSSCRAPLSGAMLVGGRVFVAPIEGNGCHLRSMLSTTGGPNHIQIRGWLVLPRSTDVFQMWSPHALLQATAIWEQLAGASDCLERCAQASNDLDFHLSRNGFNSIPPTEMHITARRGSHFILTVEAVGTHIMLRLAHMR